LNVPPKDLIVEDFAIFDLHMLIGFFILDDSGNYFPLSYNIHRFMSFIHSLDLGLRAF